MAEAPPYPPLLPWAVLGTVAAIVMALHPPSLAAWDPFNQVTDRATALYQPFRDIHQDHAGLIALGDSRMASVFTATPLARWLNQCGVVAEAPVGLYVPRLNFAAIGAMTPRLRALGPDTVILQLDMFHEVAFGEVTPERVESQKSVSRAAFTLGRDFVHTMRAIGATVVVVDLPLGHEKWAEYTPDSLKVVDQSLIEVRALGIPVLQAERAWDESLFSDGVHFNELGAARLRAWLCAELPKVLSDDAPAHR